VAGVRILPHRQRAALVELALERERQRLLPSLLARLVVEPADADAADVTWYDRLRAGESVAARERREQQQQRDGPRQTTSPRPPATRGPGGRRACPRQRSSPGVPARRLPCAGRALPGGAARRRSPSPPVQ